MDVSTAIRIRRSVRYFHDQEIPEETLRAVVRDAQSTPSWANSQPWTAYVATGDILARIKQEHLTASRAGMRGGAEFQTVGRQSWSPETRQNMAQWWEDLHDHLGPRDSVEYGDSQAELFNAAAIVYLTIPRNSTLWSVLDLGAFMQTLMLSAVGHGLQTMSAYETVKFPQIVRPHMGIPESETLAIGVALGYADERTINRFVPDRVPLESILTIKK
ncbi:MAG TPA: nitroreductase [Actinomycetaceae bacterium]|nr:nitroreductase [Actinomycetaceae bacterium]